MISHERRVKNRSSQPKLQFSDHSTTDLHPNSTENRPDFTVLTLSPSHLNRLIPSWATSSFTDHISPSFSWLILLPTNDTSIAVSLCNRRDRGCFTKKFLRPHTSCANSHDYQKVLKTTTPRVSSARRGHASCHWNQSLQSVVAREDWRWKCTQSAIWSIVKGPK